MNPAAALQEGEHPLTLVLLPGLACDDDLWTDLRPALAPFAPVVSDAHFRAPTVAAMADRVLADRAGPLVLAGASLGGMVALHAALAAPDRVRGLVLLGTSARADTPEVVALRRQAIGEFAAGRTAGVLAANLPYAFHRAPSPGDAAWARYHAMVARAGDGALIAQNEAAIARADLRPRLADVACPTLVMTGDDDALTPPSHGREIAAAIPGAEWMPVPQCGHMLTWERPDVVGPRMAAWLAARVGRWGGADADASGRRPR